MARFPSVGGDPELPEKDETPDDAFRCPDDTPIDGIVLDGLDGRWDEWEDEGEGNEDDDSPLSGPVRDPADRVWRHPSEVFRVSSTPPSPTGKPSTANGFGPKDPTVPLLGSVQAKRDNSAADGGGTGVSGLRRIIGRFDGPTGPLPNPHPVDSRSAGRALVSLAAMFAVGALLTATVMGLMNQNQPASRGLEMAPTTVRAPRLTAQTAAEQVRPSLVQLSSSASPGMRSSGMIYRPSGEILTSARLVERGGKLSATLLDGSQLPATVVGLDNDTDLAVVRVHGPTLEAVRVVSSSTLRPGTPAVTVGLDEGGRDTSVTSGVVAGLRRTMNLPTGDDLIGLIQVDRPVSLSCSGGALVGPTGDVVGFLVAGDGTLPWGYAVPGEVAVQVADQLIDKGKVEWAWMGIDGSNSTTPAGVTVRRIRLAGPDKSAQLNIDDVITQVDGMKVESVEQLNLILRSYRPGNQVDVTVHRRGIATKVELRLTLLTRPN